MIKIYHVPRTRSIRVIWTCEELGLAYDLIPVDFSLEYRSSPEWRALNPVGKVPVLIDDDFALFESGAMVQYLLDRNGEGRLQPPVGTPEHAIYLQWSLFAEATFARPICEIVNHRRSLPEEHQSAVAIAEMQDRAQLCVEALNSAVAEQDYILGNEFSAADIMLGYSLMLAQRFLSEPLPAHAAAYFERLVVRPGYVVATADI